MAKIIIVEDDINLANIYKDKLTKGGHSAKVVSDMDAAKEILETKPNLVLLDILMPHVSGLDVLKKVKADAKIGPTIPILLLTNVAEDTTIAKGLELGAYGYLLKSETTPEQVLSRVNMTLEETAPAKP